MKFYEAASLPSAALTTLIVIRNAGITDLKDKNFLVLGGSGHFSTFFTTYKHTIAIKYLLLGGVGTIAIQYLKSQGAKTTTTCSKTAFPLMTELGADFLVDYRSDNLEKEVESHGP